MTNLFLSSLFFTLFFVIAQWSQVMTGKKLQCLLKPWLRMASFICFCSKLITGPAQIQEMKMQTAHLDERNGKIVLQRSLFYNLPHFISKFDKLLALRPHIIHVSHIKKIYTPPCCSIHNVSFQL